jgi:hypothetical protein
MRNAFVGLVSRQGLEALLPENGAACRWSLNMARTCFPSGCLWAVLERAAAAEVLDLLADGQPRAALEALSLAAESIGPLTHRGDNTAVRS